jgi:predicted permease
MGCANLGIMLLVRGQRHVKETGVRAALGASRVQLVLPIFFEASIIGVAGAALAVAITALTFKLLLLQVPPAAYGNLAVGVDLRVALYALALGLTGGMVFAVVPAWRSAKLDVQALIQGRVERVLRRGRLGGPLVALQAGLAVVLVGGAVRVGHTFISVLNEPLGFEPGNVITAEFLPHADDGYTRAVEALAQRPDVVSAGVSYQLPLDGSAPYTFLAKDGTEIYGAGVAPVLPGYFETARIQLKRGRLLDWDDVRAGGEAAVIAESAARIVFGERDPVGQTFEVAKGPTFRVVGVVADTVRSPHVQPVAYVIPWKQKLPMKVVVRTRSANDAILADIKREVATLAPGVPINTQWWTDTLDALPRYRDPRFQTLVLGTFGGLALTLTALGIFGVTAFAVAIRLKEMGIRLALGAEGRSLARMMVRQALGPVGVGLVLGLVATRWAGRLAETQAGLIAEPMSAWVLVAAGATVAVAALLAAYVPARRASRVDPMVVLRSE